MKFLRDYVQPLQQRFYLGNFNHITDAVNFVVRYKPTEQAFLRPHNDASSYTTNVALNHVGIDYTGGGCHFLRYNCAVTETQKGHMIIHPGKLTHQHEGLLVTNGTRYILVSFVRQWQDNNN